MNMKTMMRMTLVAALAVAGLTGCMTVKEGNARRTHAHRARAGRPSPQHRHKLPPRPAQSAPVESGR